MVSLTYLSQEQMRIQKAKRDLAELKEKLKHALAGEKDAKQEYSEIVNLAMRSGQAGIAGRTRSLILEQELQHANIIWGLIRDVEQAEANLIRAESDLKRRQHEETKRAEQRRRY